MKRILVIDCDSGSRAEVCERLIHEGYEVSAGETSDVAVDALREGAKVAVICHAPRDASALDLLRTLREIDADVRVILSSSSGHEQVEALEQGAYYATRAAMGVEEVLVLVRRALSSRDERPTPSSNPPSAEEWRPSLIGESAELRKLREAISRLGATPNTPVLVVGESGAGKSTIASVLHCETAAGGPFVHLPAPSSADSLELSALLRKAQGGTLFLGDVGDVPLAMQGELLRFLQHQGEQLDLGQEPTLRTRVMATSTQPLDAAAQSGAVRSALAYRLAVVTLRVPPLRERRDDIPLLVDYFLRRLSLHSRHHLRGVSSGVMSQFVAHAWPGNVRELRNVLESAALLSDGECLDSVRLRHFRGASRFAYRLPSQGIDFRDLERDVLEQALELAAGNQTRAALLLGLTRDQIRYRMSKFGMTTTREPSPSNERAA
jgi:DNA-binding NtrC family response regulator